MNFLFFYEPFGQTTTKSNYPFEYAGRTLIDGSLYYYRSRYYHPATERFLSEDPISLSADATGSLISGANLYLYANNNPVRFEDPTGLTPPPPITCVAEGIGRVLADRICYPPLQRMPVAWCMTAVTTVVELSGEMHLD